MDYSIILIMIGIVCIIISFFIKDSTKKIEKDIEDLSISIYQETNSIKRRLKVVEEELMLEPNFQVKSPANSNTINKAKKNEFINTLNPKQQELKKTKPIPEILVRQVIELDKQGYSVSEISKLSTLAEVRIQEILQNSGGIK